MATKWRQRVRRYAMTRCLPSRSWFRLTGDRRTTPLQPVTPVPPTSHLPCKILKYLLPPGCQLIGENDLCRRETSGGWLFLCRVRRRGARRLLWSSAPPTWSALFLWWSRRPERRWTRGSRLHRFLRWVENARWSLHTDMVQHDLHPPTPSLACVVAHARRVRLSSQQED